MKTVEELKPNYAPVYAAALYPELSALFHRHGYALACHGSLARDFDLVAVPWADAVSKPEEVVQDVTKEFAIRVVGENEVRAHGRLVITLSVGFGHCSIDLSFFPTIA